MNKSAADPLDRVRELAPLIAASTAEIERTQRLPKPLFEALLGAGMFHLLLPRPFGGGEVDPLTHVQVIEAIAKLDGSTAWVLNQTAVAAMTAARLKPEVAQKIWGNGRGVVAWGPGPNARAVAVDGGFRVSGTFAFASGCWYATWLGADCVVYEANGQPRLSAGGVPVHRRMLFPAEQAKMREIWNVIGLRGTGSDGYVLDDLFVPAEHTVARIDDPSERRYPGRLYDVSMHSMFSSGFSCLALGIARAMLDALVALAQEKTPRGFKSTLGNDEVVQSDLGYAEAQLRSARHFVLAALGDAWDHAQATGEVTVDQRMAIRLASTYAIREAKCVADFAYNAAGATAVFASGPFERRFRDLHTVGQQLQGRKSHYRTVGRYLMGLGFEEEGWH